LLNDLVDIVGGATTVARVKGWPGRPRDLSGALRRLAPALRREGIEVEYLPRETTGDRKRPVRITSLDGDRVKAASG
jgi:hypothetical protein